MWLGLHRSLTLRRMCWMLAVPWEGFGKGTWTGWQVAQYNNMLAASVDFDLMHMTLARDFDPQAAPPVTVSSMGKLRGPTFDIERFLTEHYNANQQ